MSTINVNQSETSSECVVCGAELILSSDDLDISELLECYECGTELEVQSVSPLVLIEAPSEGEDWGE